MNTDQILKKLKEIQVDAFNNVHSAEEESELQLESATEEHNCEPAGGEEVKITRPKAEKVPEIKTLSRTTPMDGSKGVPEKIYVTDGTVKSITIESIQAQLDDLKKNMDGDNWGGELGRVLTAAEGILRESAANPEKYQRYQNELKMLKFELKRKQPELKSLKHIVEMFPEGM